MSLLHSIKFRHAIHFLACITLDLTSLSSVKIKHTFRKRAVQPITAEEGSIPSHNTADQVNKNSTNESNQDKNERYDERRLEIILQCSTPQTPTQYDYDSLRDEYYNDLQKELYNNKNFNYTQHDRFEETTEDAINESFYFNTIKNCSKEEYSNFGIKSMMCSLDGFRKSRTKQDKMHFFKSLMKIVAIWLLICIVIGITCVCQFGKHKYRALLSSCL
jgi:hypothetical protein